MTALLDLETRAADLSARVAALKPPVGGSAILADVTALPGVLTDLADGFSDLVAVVKLFVPSV